MRRSEAGQNILPAVRGPPTKSPPGIHSPLQSKEQSKLEPIQVFLEGQSLSTTPSTVATREQCREWKKLGTGYFISSGKQFRLVDLFHPAVVNLVSSRFGAIRDASVCPRETMVQAYVGCYGEMPEKRAKAIIDNGWIRNSHGQEFYPKMADGRQSHQSLTLTPLDELASL